MKNKTFSSRTLLMVIAITLIVGSVVGGTLAWLVDKTNSVVNTFTYGDINLELDETVVDEDGKPVDKDEDGKDDKTTEGNEYEMMPGKEIDKDPTVTVKAESEKAWLFVKLEKSENFDDFLEYEIAEGWTQLKDKEGEDVEGVYFRLQEATEKEDVSYSVLKDDQVTVKETVTKEMLNELDKEGEEATYPELTVTAYAIQYLGFEPELDEGAEEPTDAQLQAAALVAWTTAGDPDATDGE